MTRLQVTPSDESLGFATWPADIQIPRTAIVRPWDKLEFLPDVTVAISRVPGEAPAFPIVEEFYLRDLFALDPNKQEDIERLITKMGFLFNQDDSGLRAFSEPITEAWGPLGGWVSYYLALNGKGHPLSRLRTQTTFKVAAQEPQPEVKAFELVDETRLGLFWLRDLTRLAISYQNSRWEEPLDIWESAQFGIKKPEDPGQTLAAFVTGISAGVRAFPIHLKVPRPYMDPRIEATLSFGAPSLYSVIVSQIFNHISEDAIYRQCENEMCKRWFVRQTDHHQYDPDADKENERKVASRTKGIKFCSAACSRAQKQRNYRRNQKAKAK